MEGPCFIEKTYFITTRGEMFWNRYEPKANNEIEDVEQKGTFTWPETNLGYRMYVRCPYAVQKAIYAYRDCLLDPATANQTEYTRHYYMDWKAKWHDEITDDCPDPPMEEALRKLKQKLGQGSTWNEYLWALKDISAVILRYGDLPVTYRDIIDIVLILYKAVIEGVQQGNVLPGRIMEDAFNICDFVLEHDIKYSSVRPLETIRLWLLEILGLLTEMLFPVGDRTESHLQGNYISIVSTLINASAGQQTFTFPMKTTNNSSSLSLNINVLDPGDHVVHVMYLGHPDIVDSRVDVIRYDGMTQPTDDPTLRPWEMTTSSLFRDNPNVSPTSEATDSEAGTMASEISQYWTGTSQSNQYGIRTSQNSQYSPRTSHFNDMTTWEDNVNSQPAKKNIHATTTADNIGRNIQATIGAAVTTTTAIGNKMDTTIAGVETELPTTVSNSLITKLYIANISITTNVSLPSGISMIGLTSSDTTIDQQMSNDGTDDHNPRTSMEYLTTPPSGIQKITTIEHTRDDVTSTADSNPPNDGDDPTSAQSEITTHPSSASPTEVRDPLDWRTPPTGVIETGSYDPLPQNRRKRGVSDGKTYIGLDTSLDIVSSIIYVSLSDRYFTGLFTPSWYKPPVEATVHLSADFQLLDLLEGRENETRCTNINVHSEISRTGFSMDTWYINPSECSEALSTSNKVVCTCSSLGFYAVIGARDSSQFLPLTDAADTPDPSKENDEPEKPYPLELFRYRHQVYVAGHVLRVTCLIFLVLTLLTYGLNRKASRGAPTHMLLHLCVSLIMLLILFYAAETVADTELGCRVINAIRYYLILVSLMWNAMEALHMYFTVINVVFSHFALKVTFIAWGIPLIGLGAVLGIDLRGFDGHYDSLCIFRCMFNDDVAYYAYIIPVIVLTLHNVILYALIIRHLLHLEDNQCQGKAWYGWPRLVGSLIVTVLLVIPWFFLAFSIVDDGSLNIDIPVNQGLYQIVFMVFVLLQGVFIFTFYCGGNSYIRSRWRATFKPVMPHSSVSDDQSNKHSNNEAQHEQIYTTKDA
ncbi:hypothetical protein LSH36_120g13012 [Paralvinella palmiformis]|uniref:G-protein coupled receptors family 2 profile 2 domain-containing protein n=1 Tax=Paralvinella palmiformis TaxID=53620 RepID=A0AAD9N8W9_9ANNE|nr:hypothetical protein LSH36_120g13012 [Paralvinella palmiformis]